MTDADLRDPGLEDRLRRTLSAVAQATGVPPAPKAGPGVVLLQPRLRRRFALAATGVAAAAALVAGGVLLTAPGARPGTAVGAVLRPSPFLPGLANSPRCRVTGRAPAILPALSYGLARGARWAVAARQVSPCGWAGGALGWPTLTLARLAPDGAVKAAVAVSDVTGQGFPAVPDAQTITVGGVRATYLPPLSLGGASVLVLRRAGRLMSIESRGLDRAALIALAGRLAFPGARPTLLGAPAAGWTDVTEPALAAGRPVVEYDVRRRGASGSGAGVTIGYGTRGSGLGDLATLPGASVHHLTVRGHPAVLVTYGGTGPRTASLRWQDSAAVRISVTGTEVAPGDASDLVTLASALQHRGPGDASPAG